MSQHPLNISEAVPSKVINFSTFKKAAKHSGLIAFPSKKDTENLQAELAALQQELAIVKQEKAELENLLKQKNQDHKIHGIQIEIDVNKLAHQVEEITQSDYFQQLQLEVKSLRNNPIA
ncbi:hypothetical protein [Anabaena sp. PCC 7108]|uniref:hypothetical protein n=1 Tax=Anabaena sp. PCC 7108 TaxID=163908 RepID=UPI00034D7ADE|nr:hypothetical protein [Anabaena sp. PCC 7108]